MRKFSFIVIRGPFKALRYNYGMNTRRGNVIIGIILAVMFLVLRLAYACDGTTGNTSVTETSQERVTSQVTEIITYID